MTYFWIAWVLFWAGVVCFIALKSKPTQRGGLLDFVAMGFLFSEFVVLIVTFAKAAFNDGAVLVTINTYGEMWAEVLMFVLAVGFSLWRLSGMLKRL